MSGLPIESLSKDSFVFLLEYIINNIGFKKAYFSRKEPNVPPGAHAVQMAAETRIDITLSGIKHMVYPDGNESVNVFIHPGELHYCPAKYWKIPVWDISHEMASVVIRKEYIRIIYLDFKYNNTPISSPGVSAFYHTSLPLSKEGQALINSIDVIVNIGNFLGFEEELIMMLLKIILRDLKNDHACRRGKAHSTWLKVNEYLRENFYYSINRASVAQVFKLNPSHLSRLFQLEGNEGFNSTLQRLRMEHSSFLLKNGNETIKEIADQCGYLSSTSFIAAFKKYYGISPGKYREVKSYEK